MGEPDFPLFPLGMFMLPGQRVQLQIFETRYLDMISDRMRHNATFGVVQIREGHEVGEAPLFFPVGTEVAIVDFTQQDNGLLGIAIEGKRRFRVQESQVRSDQLLVAQVEWLPDEGEEPISDTFDDLRLLLRKLRSHPGVGQLQLPKADTLSQLGWQLSLLLPLSLPEKMRLWEESDPTHRLELTAGQVEYLRGR